MTAIVAPAPAKIYTPENLVWEDIKGWDGKTMRHHMATPLRSHILQVIASRSLAEVQEVAAAQPVELVPEPLDNAALLAEAQRLADAAVPVPVVPVVPQKIVVDYQVTDDEGNPIGRPTHLEAANWEEMSIKQKEAHTQATRAFYRLKSQKITFKQPAPVVPAELSDAAILNAIRDLKSEDPKTALAAVRAINKTEADRAKAEADAALASERELRRQEYVSNQFLRAHQHDFNPCQANIKLFEGYFNEHQLAWTVDNLEIALQALDNELAPVVKPAAPTAPVNPPPVVQPTPTTVAAQPVVQPVVTVPALVPAPVNPPALATRPGVNGGLVPGQNSAPRPAPKTSKLTDEEVRSWDGKTMRDKMKNPTLRAEILQFVADRNARKALQTA
jgi:hypothetical protein